MKQVLIRQGQVVVETVPAPRAEPGRLLVRVDHSCLSPGTERAGLEAQSDPLWIRALKKPRAVKSVLKMAATQGLGHTRTVVTGKLSEGQPAGYSAAGRIVECGAGISDLKPGDRVACGGAQCAHHAEVISVPRNLAVPVPEGVDLASASTVSLGAIALQGVRRASPTLGETFVVAGLGALGQLTLQILRRNGCRVLGIDPAPDRRALASSLGLEWELDPDQPELVEQVHRLTSGNGADGVIITAGSPSDEIISQSFRMCRRKGRVVLVGNVGLHLRREDFYKKEIDFLISTSYGPGRYDPLYEEKGIDYPIGYVRWTENRNMGEYLQLLKEGAVRMDPLIQKRFPVDQAAEAYACLRQDADRPLLVLLDYPDSTGDVLRPTVLVNPSAGPARKDRVRLALVGAGSFLKAMHLPLLKTLEDRYQVRLVVSRSGASATQVARQCGAAEASTDLNRALEDPEIDALLVTTPHGTHADIVLRALSAGKHVFVEKPLAITQEELDRIVHFYEAAGENPPVLLTGFNRRFSPLVERIAQTLRNRSHPMILTCRVNAGYLPMDHPLHRPEAGGRNLGEACHFYDLFNFLTQSRVEKVQGISIRPESGYYGPGDNFSAAFRFEDGSVAHLIYTALGNPGFPKERLEVFAEGRVYVLDDYLKLSVTGLQGRNLELRKPDKGHRRELERFAEVLQQGGDWPIPLWQQVQATQMALDVETQIKTV